MGPGEALSSCCPDPFSFQSFYFLSNHGRVFHADFSISQKQQQRNTFWILPQTNPGDIKVLNFLLPSKRAENRKLKFNKWLQVSNTKTGLFSVVFKGSRVIFIFDVSQGFPNGEHLLPVFTHSGHDKMLEEEIVTHLWHPVVPNCLISGGCKGGIQCFVFNVSRWNLMIMITLETNWWSVWISLRFLVISLKKKIIKLVWILLGYFNSIFLFLFYLLIIQKHHIIKKKRNIF